MSVEIPADIIKAIDACIDGALSFAVCALPGEESYRFYASEHTTSFGDARGTMQRFVIGAFDASVEPIVVPMELSTDDAIRIAQSRGGRYEYSELYPSTSYEQYACGARQIIDILRRTGAKTVLSRVVALRSKRRFTDVVTDYFKEFPQTMRFVYYTPQTGIWFGASPELLLDYDASEGRVRTMSLAGTRRCDAQGEWDHKNLVEHQYVTDYIMDVLRSFGMTPVIDDSSPLVFGNIQHLCDRISAHGNVDAIALIRNLSPTPALCGYPRQDAYNQIMATEAHNRSCYGGWLAVDTCATLRAYVNLRCSKVALRRCGDCDYNLYLGGGLTSESEVDAEWQETQAKGSALTAIITKDK